MSLSVPPSELYREILSGERELEVGESDKGSDRVRERKTEKECVLNGGQEQSEI